MGNPKRILIYAYGNPGRQDDGLGNCFVEALEPWLAEKGLKQQVRTESNYQLNIEDADAIAGQDIAVFVDASIENIEDIHFGPVEASEGKSEFTMHAASPAYVLALCQKIYNKFPETHLLQIRGYEWEFKEGLSAQAEKNLSLALEFIKEKILSWQKQFLL